MNVQSAEPPPPPLAAQAMYVAGFCSRYSCSAGAAAGAASRRPVIEVAGQKVRITRDVVLAIRAALITQIEQSKLPHKEALLAETRDTTVTFSPGMARFGLWILSALGDRLQLIFRQPSDAPVAHYYQAEVANRAGQWPVENLRVVSMRRAR